MSYREERVNQEFWIDPYGKVHKPTKEEAEDAVSVHYEIAKRLKPDLEHPQDVLHDLNWIAIGSAVYGNRIKNEPTQAQINTLWDLGIRRIWDDQGNLYEY